MEGGFPNSNVSLHSWSKRGGTVGVQFSHPHYACNSSVELAEDDG